MMPWRSVSLGTMRAPRLKCWRRLREQRSFAVEDLVVDTELLESARDAGYATKVVFVSTEDPNLNVGRILIRLSRGGQSVPLDTIPESYEQSLKSLTEARKHADDVLVYDNTPRKGASACGPLHRGRIGQSDAFLSTVA
jgi:predicted ABC-type ATPase